MKKTDAIFKALLEMHKDKEKKSEEQIISSDTIKTPQFKKITNPQDYIDSLTGLKNEIWLEEELNRKMVDANRLGTNVWLLMIDFDYFKDINSEYGRSSGNHVLKLFGEMMINEKEPIARIGGEEFMQIFARDLSLEEIQQIVTKYSIGFKKKTKDLLKQEVTLSFGIAQMNFGEIPSNYINRVEAALFKSKKNGRDRATLLEGHPRTGTYVTIPFLTEDQLTTISPNKTV